MAEVPKIPPSEITPERDYEQRPKERRTFLRNAGLAAVGAAVFGGGLFLATKKRGNAPAPDLSSLRELEVDSAPTAKELASVALGDRDELTKIEDVTTYNNFYEFGLDKSEPAENAGTLITRPWTVDITGEVAKPEKIGIDDLMKVFPPEERIYRMRCVEAWSMVIPWVGIPLAKILSRVQPTSRAKYVAFKTLLDPKTMPGQREQVLPWPYVEGLRMDEAMHPLTLMAVGLYGRELPNQNGAPFRLVVPWKYGFKGIKSIVEIRLVEDEPRTTWSSAAPSEYGFYANVNPDVSHPRWSQASERRIGTSGRRPTLPFNGYGEQVAHLYSNMDLRRNF